MRVLLVTILMGAFAAGFGGDLGASRAVAEDAGPPGDGALCFMALVTVANEVGKTCFPGKDPQVQQELQRTVNRLDTYVVKNGYATVAELTEFKKTQAHVGAPKEEMCQATPELMYQKFVENGADGIRDATDKILAAGGKPTWGSCL